MDDKYTRMLIPLDGSKTAENVLPYARTLARTLQIPVELMEVFDIARVATHIPADKGPHLDTVMAEMERRSEDYLRKIAESFSRVSVQCTVAKGRPENAIIEKAAADERALIAMATHGRSGISRWLLGSVAEKVLRGARNPLFLVRASQEGQTEGEADIKSIIVTLDGSELAESVLPTAVNLALLLNLEMVLFRAYELPATAYYGNEDYLPNYDQLRDQVKEEAAAYLDAKAAAIKAGGLEKVSSMLMEGPGPDEIITYARKTPNAIVAMCTHGRSGVQRWVLGSVTEKVVRHSGDPVLVVRAG
jgi:nucleotide-binding universal stress UspA family protein